MLSKRVGIERLSGEHEANTASLYRGLSVGDISMGEVKTQDITPDLI